MEEIKTSEIEANAGNAIDLRIQGVYTTSKETKEKAKIDGISCRSDAPRSRTLRKIR